MLGYCSFPLGKAGMGLRTGLGLWLGCGFYGGWSAPLATLSELLLLAEAPPHALRKPLPKGREFLLAVFEAVVWCSFPLGKVGMGLQGWDGACRWMVRTPGNSVGVAIS